LKSVIVGAAIAAVALMLGHSLTHLYAARRERRADLAAALDKTLAAFVAGDRTLSSLIVTVASRHGDLHKESERYSAEATIREIADKVEEYEVAIRSAVFSLRIRRSAHSPLAEGFERASLLFSDSYMPLTPLLHGEPQNPVPIVEAAHQAHQQYREAFDAAMDIARRELAPRRA
jgi:hypothetical protein